MRFLLTTSLIIFSVGCNMAQTVKLPPPNTIGKMSVEEAISSRRSHRDFSERALTIQEISQLLWCCQGITDTVRGLRAAPSAGATYPFETYIIVGNVKDIPPGLYRYIIKSHSLEQVRAGDLRKDLMTACLGQDFIGEAPATIVLAYILERTSRRYGERANRYIAMEAGHIGENLHLQCEAIGLGTVMVGAFKDSEVKKVLSINEEPLYIMPIGESR